MIYGSLLGSRVLIVEDDYAQASNLTRALEMQGSDVVGPFSDVVGGLNAVKHATVDVAVLDIRLRDGQVFELADDLRDRGVPFVFVTACDQAKLPSRYYDIKCIPKPVDHERITLLLAITLATQAGNQTESKLPRWSGM